MQVPLDKVGGCFQQRVRACTAESMVYLYTCMLHPRFSLCMRSSRSASRRSWSTFALLHSPGIRGMRKDYVTAQSSETRVTLCGVLCARKPTRRLCRSVDTNSVTRLSIPRASQKDCTSLHEKHVPETEKERQLQRCENSLQTDARAKPFKSPRQVFLCQHLPHSGDATRSDASFKTASKKLDGTSTGVQMGLGNVHRTYCRRECDLTRWVAPKPWAVP